MTYLMYLRSLLRHKWYVFLECCKLGMVLRGIFHDATKFLPREFIPYARYFYGEHDENVEMDFDYAWLHHQHSNLHHWQRWTLTLDSARSDGKLIALPIPETYLKEMLADWRGAGRAFGNNDTKGWYLSHKDEINLAPESRAWIEERLLK